MESWLLIRERGDDQEWDWRRRWCVLRQPEELVCYQDDHGGDPTRKLQIGTMSKLCPFTQRYAPGCCAQYARTRPFGFVIVNRFGGKLQYTYFDALEPYVLADWMAAVAETVAPQVPAFGADVVGSKQKTQRLPSLGQLSNQANEDSDCAPLLPWQLIRRMAHSAEVIRQLTHPLKLLRGATQWRDDIAKALTKSCLFAELELDDLSCMADVCSVVKFDSAALVVKRHQHCSVGYIILEGHARAQKCDNGSDSISLHVGDSIGFSALMWDCPQPFSVYAESTLVLAKLERFDYQRITKQRHFDSRSRREECLRQVHMLETLNDEQIARIADAFGSTWYEEGQEIIRQDEEGDEFFVLIEGSCVCLVTTGTGQHKDVQEVMRYSPGQMFGELALLQRGRRKATVRAQVRSHLLVLCREAFERMLGPLEQVNATTYLTDPRKILSDFFLQGDLRGPRGMSGELSKDLPADKTTHWFAVYRPTSRDAIAKMLDGVAVGKGLNVKGKSAKKNNLSGFVPFLQISRNSHKDYVEMSPPDARTKIYYASVDARKLVMAQLEPLLSLEAKLDIREGDRHIALLDDYSGLFGIDLPEAIAREAYVMKPDLTPDVGWETGRQSEPAFMNMNLHSVRAHHKPLVVLCQYDHSNPMNPHGLLIAYAEASVKPVVSDFDTFTIGSRNMQYQPLSPEQVKIAKWSLETTRTILENPGEQDWTSRWLTVLQKASHDHELPEIPEYGFGDGTSIELTQNMVEATAASGAVRHGAECFDFVFPQELDDSYLIIWEEFIKTEGKPWHYVDEEELRSFLSDRVREGFSFPMNAVWPVRDEGWYKLFVEMEAREDAKQALNAWYPPESGLIPMIHATHEKFPNLFQPIGYNVVQTKSAVTRTHGQIANVLMACTVGQDSSDDASPRSKRTEAARAWRKAKGRSKMLQLLCHEVLSKRLGE